MSHPDNHRDKRVSTLQSEERSSGILRSIIFAPISLSLAAVSAGLSILRPFAPRLVPLVIFSAFVPITALLSASAGWIVWSSLSVSWEVPLYLQYGDGVSPYAYVQLPTLTPTQRYDLYVDLLLPCSDSNLALGNFMTTLTLSTSGNKTLTHVRRPAIVLPSRSFLLFERAITCHVKVSLLESFTAPRSKLVANVEIGRQDRWTTLGAGVGRELSVYSAHLRGLIVPHGIRGVAIRLPLLSSLLSAGVFFLILSLILGTCVLPLVLPTTDDVEDQQYSKVKTELKEQDSYILPTSRNLAQGRADRRRRRSRSAKNEGGEGSTTIKTEAPEEILLSTEEDPARGLRRRSSKSAIRSAEA